MLLQFASLVGAAFALSAYLGYQRGWMDRNTVTYNALNLGAGIVLTTVATIDGRLGFIVLNVVWAIVAIPPLFRGVRAKFGRYCKGAPDPQVVVLNSPYGALKLSDGRKIPNGTNLRVLRRTDGGGYVCKSDDHPGEEFGVPQHWARAA